MIDDDDGDSVHPDDREYLGDELFSHPVVEGDMKGDALISAKPDVRGAGVTPKPAGDLADAIAGDVRGEGVAPKADGDDDAPPG